MNKFILRAVFSISTLVLSATFMSGCKSSAIVEPEGTETYDLISEDLNALHSELKAVERIKGKPLEPAIYDLLDKAKQAAKKKDLKSAQKYYAATIDLVRDDLVDEATIEEFRKALKSIKRRLDYDGPSQEAWSQFVILATKERLKSIVIPEFTIGPPATIIDAIEFIKQASRDYDDPKVPIEQRGVSLILKLHSRSAESEAGELDDPFAAPESNDDSGIPVLPRISVRDISLYDALSLICKTTGTEFNLRGGIIMLTPVGEVPQYPNMNAEELNRLIKADLDHFNEELKTLERIHGKPLDQEIYETLDEAKLAAEQYDYDNSRNLYGQTSALVRAYLIDGSALEQYRQALENIDRRFDWHSSCKVAWDELRELRTKMLLEKIIIPEMTFRPPATLIDAVEFFKQASRDYGDPDLAVEQRGVSLCLKLRNNNPGFKQDGENDPFSVDPFGNNGAPVIPALSARFINLYDALQLVCDVTGYKLKLRGGIIMIVPGDEDED